MTDGTGMHSPESLDDLVTEAGGAPAADYNRRSTRELVELMGTEDATVPAVVGQAAGGIATAIDAIVERLMAGGRLIYVGAGTSGGLAALDAGECETTFSAPAWQVVAVTADEAALEDDRELGARELERLGVSAADAVVGISASGRTPFVVGGVETAAGAGAVTVALVSTRDSELARLTDHEISVVVGPEFLAGSTRLKAGTAQKLVLNMVSTISMIRLGKTFGNLMVDLAAANDKLRARVHRIVRTATGATPEEVEEALDAAEGDAKVAIVSLLGGVDAETARAKLSGANGNVRQALAR